MNNNVIVFPRSYSGPPRNPEESEVNLEELKENYIEQILEYLDSIIFQQLSVAGFPIENDSFTKDNTLIHEAIRSLMLRYYGIEHPLQHLSDIIFNNNNRIIISQVDNEGKQIEPNIEIVT